MKAFVEIQTFSVLLFICAQLDVRNEVEVENVILYWCYNNNLEKEVITSA